MDELEKLLTQIKDSEQETVTEFKRALIAMQNLDDAAMLTLKINKYTFELPLVIVEAYWGFTKYLAEVIEALDGDQ